MSWKFGKNLGLDWSWKRAVGISRFRQKFARKIGIPTTMNGVNQKIGRFVTSFVKNLFK